MPPPPCAVPSIHLPPWARLALVGAAFATVGCAALEEKPALSGASTTAGRTVWQRSRLPAGGRVAYPQSAKVAFDSGKKLLVVESGRAVMASGASESLPVASWGVRGQLDGKAEVVANPGAAVTLICHEGTFRLQFPGSGRPPATLKRGQSASVVVKKPA